MKITKYEHSCLDITDNKTRIIIDPGKFSKSLTNYANIDAIVISHIHSDHFDKTVIESIVQANPTTQIFTVKQVKDELLNHANVKTVVAGDIIKIKDINLSFFGGQHEFYSEFENIAVMIDDTVFHPGDSYTIPDKQFKVLAAPASAPWLRVRDACDYIASCKPKIALPIHDILLSPEGKEIHYQILKEVCEEHNISWQVLEPGQSIEI